MKTFKEQKWMIIIYAVVAIAIGLVEAILAFVDINTAIKAVSYTIAIGLFAIGLMHILSSLIAYTKSFFKASLVFGAFAIAVGIVLIMIPSLIAEFLIPFVACLALALGAVMLAKAIIGIVFKYKGLWIFLYFLFFAAATTLGILILVYQGASRTAIFGVTGIAVALAGVALLVFGIRLLTKKEDSKTEEK